MIWQNKTYKVPYIEFDWLFNNILPIIQEKNKQEDKYDDISKDTLLELQASGYTCLGEAWPPAAATPTAGGGATETQGNHQAPFCQLLARNLNKNTWRVDVSILKTTNKFYDR